MNAGDLGSVPGLGRPLGEGNGYSLQYCGLENSTDSSTASHRVGHTERLSLHLTYLKVCCCGTSRTVSSFPHHSETCCGVTGRAEDTRRDTCARGRGPKPGPFVALHPRTLASILTPWPTARLAWAEPPPGLPQVGLVLGSFRLFNAVVNGIAR